MMGELGTQDKPRRSRWCYPAYEPQGNGTSRVLESRENGVDFEVKIMTLAIADG